MTDLYSTLGVDKNASKEDIKKAYRKRAKDNHPDKTGSENEEIKDIVLAYSVLIDDKKRAHYDKTGQTAETPFEKQFEGYVNQMFIGIIHACPDVDKHDLIDKFKELTSESIRNGHKSLREANERLLKFNKVLKRLKKKQDKDFVIEVVERHRDGITNEINSVKEQMEFYKKAIDAIDDYYYEFDEEEEDEEEWS